MEGASRKTFDKVLGRKLSFKAKYIDQLFSGEKTTTVRRGIVMPRYDIVYIESDGRIYGTARVKYVRYTKLSELTNEDAVKDGFNSKEELLQALREIYPDIGKDEWVTIISLDNLNRFPERARRKSHRSRTKKGKIRGHHARSSGDFLTTKLPR
jgi:hypothetical protein